MVLGDSLVVQSPLDSVLSLPEPRFHPLLRSHKLCNLAEKKKAKQNLVLAVTPSAPLPRLCCPCCAIGSPHPCYRRGRFKNLALRRTKEGKSLSSFHFLLIYFNTGTNPALTYSWRLFTGCHASRNEGILFPCLRIPLGSTIYPRYYSFLMKIKYFSTVRAC